MSKYVICIPDTKNVFDFGTVTPYIEPDLDAIRKEAYEKGLSDGKNQDTKDFADMYDSGYSEGLKDAWDAAKKIFCTSVGELKRIFDLEEDENGLLWIYHEYSASEAIERIKQYEQKEEKPISVEDVMREYLYTFCEGRSCVGCPLHTDDFTCGRGYHFSTTNSVSDEEIRRAYTKVLQEKRES